MGLALQISKKKMTLGQFYSRFLKENEIYYYYWKISVGYTGIPIKIIKKINNDNSLFTLHLLWRDSIIDLFYHSCRFLPCFVGGHESTQRRKFYRINRKWKDYIHSFKVQHNINVGDIVYIQGRYYSNAKNIVIGFENNYMICRPFSTKHTAKYDFKTSIFKVIGLADKGNNKKELITNIFYSKDNKEHGKITGNYNEMEL